jgi:heme/copper-type cytochrome/quinol oxidase subunit 2
MTSQRKTPILLTLTIGLAAGGIVSCGPAAAVDPQEASKSLVSELTRESKEPLDLLRRDAGRVRPDCMVMATAGASGWDFAVIYAKDKSLAQPSKAVNSAASNALPLTDLVLLQNSSVGLHVTSNDDISPFVVPGLSLRTVAVPGRMQLVPIDTTKQGVFPSACTAPCAARNKDMTFTIHIVDIITFHRWGIARDAAIPEPKQH